MDFSGILQSVRAMSVEDRLCLVQAIWDEIAADPNGLPLTDEQKRELDRRLADDDANPHDTIAFEEVLAQARARKQG